MKDIENIISQMTLEEKASLCSGRDFWYLKGIERLGIPSIMITDGPHGLRKQAEDSGRIGLAESIPATCFPTASALAATWNCDLIHQVGMALGEACRQEKVGVILGPGVNIKRSPLCGRNFEYFSEDPYLTGEMARSHISGVQSQGIGTSLKHFAVNNQEFRRMTIDAIVDERALREIYLLGYEIAVKGAQPWTVMCAYNRLNGTYCCEHKSLLTDILKKEWGHEGLVVTDWGAMNDRVAALAAGTELEMPGINNGNNARIVIAVQSGQLDEAVLDGAVARILAMIFKAQETLSNEYTYNPEAQHTLARRVAGEGAVLLKNEAGILPLKKSTKIVLIGHFAKIPRYQGAGSSLMNPTRLDNLYDEVVKLVGEAHVSYAAGYPIKADLVDDNLILEAVKVAKLAEIVVVCAGLPDIYEVEGLDREHMKLPPSHNALISAITAVHSSVVVVLWNGSPVEMPWVNEVQGILEAYLGGQAGAGAIADILYGDVNPSGKLAETFPLKLEDNPSYYYFPGGPKTVEYRESIYVGYRFYDSVKAEVLFPFGHGLSYTTFEYSDLFLNKNIITDSETLTVSLTVKNTGQMQGAEIVQLYVRDLEPTTLRPFQELKGFTKVALESEEQATVTMTLDQRAFAYYNVDLKSWHVESGRFEIRLGSSSRDIRLVGTVQVKSAGPSVSVSDRSIVTAYYNFPPKGPVSKEDFEKLYGKILPGNQTTVKGHHTINTPIGDMQDSFIGRQLASIVKRQIQNLIKDDPESLTAMLMKAIVKDAPLRIMLMFGRISREVVDALLLMINGKVLKGSVALIKARRSTRD